ncbi:sulfotransferase 2B1-like [Saccoglossus kowalevskii]|uniref:Sulfotransferase family cytosolic 2B member 1-like n=1 Tax=Saccoglossus kowalevskii TaxID=10224 RepID=A0ABM0MRD6_SACKO|nr:PREDICTED: sulfotransferase family cytosolic 2B member 1-like [Saccoglossus kowalevskii]
MSDPMAIFKNEGVSFIDGLHDIGALKARRIDLWDIRDDDIIINTFPKSGTTWMLRLVSEMYPDLHWQLKPTNLATRPFCQRKVMFGPWADHVIGWRRFGIEDGVLHVTYEDMKTDLKSVSSQISQFLSRPIDDDQLNRALNKSTFQLMKEAGDDDYFMPPRDETSWWAGETFFRKGKIGDWKSHFTVAQNEMFDDKISRILEENGVTLVYE